MRRRDFVVCLGSAMLAWPLAVWAQKPAIPFIGYLHSGSPNERARHVEAFRRGLKEGGYADGKDVAIEYRWAEGQQDRLPKLAAELVDRKVSVIFATGGPAPALAAKSATSNIPIVFTGGTDPVKLGLVASLGRPGKNLTGVVNLAGALHAKRLEILRELVPSAARIAYLVNPKLPGSESFVKEVEMAAGRMGTTIRVYYASNEAEIDTAFAAFRRDRVN